MSNLNDYKINTLSMLANNPIDPILLVTDFPEAKNFYVKKLELEIIEEDEHRIVLGSGSTRVSLSLSSVGTKDSQTKASWRVADLEKVLNFLRNKEIKIEEYDDEYLKTNNGIADVGFALASWIIDPFGNALSILQMK